MGSQAQPQSGTVVSGSSPEHRAIYKPSHGEITRARAHVVQRLKNELLTRLEVTGSVDRVKFEAEFGPVTQKHIACINQHILNAGLHFEVLPKLDSKPKSKTIYCSEIIAPKPQ